MEENLLTLKGNKYLSFKEFEKRFENVKHNQLRIINKDLPHMKSFRINNFKIKDKDRTNANNLQKLNINKKVYKISNHKSCKMKLNLLSKANTISEQINRLILRRVQKFNTNIIKYRIRNEEGIKGNNLNQIIKNKTYRILSSRENDNINGNTIQNTFRNYTSKRAKSMCKDDKKVINIFKRTIDKDSFSNRVGKIVKIKNQREKIKYKIIGKLKTEPN